MAIWQALLFAFAAPALSVMVTTFGSLDCMNAVNSFDPAPGECVDFGHFSSFQVTIHDHCELQVFAAPGCPEQPANRHITITEGTGGTCEYFRTLKTILMHRSLLEQ